MTLSTDYYSDQMKVNEIGKSCSAHVGDDKYIYIYTDFQCFTVHFSIK